MSEFTPLVPDRPLRWGEMLLITFRYLRRNAAATLGIGALLGTVTSVVDGVIVDGLLVGRGRLDRFTALMSNGNPTAADLEAVATELGQALPYLSGALLVAMLVQLAAMGVMTLGMVRAMQGARLEPAALWRAVPWRRIVTINVLVTALLIAVALAPALLAFSVDSTFVSMAALGFASVAALITAVVASLAVPAALLQDLPARASLRSAMTVARGGLLRTTFLVFGSLLFWDAIGTFVGSPLGSIAGALAGGAKSAAGSTLATLVTNIVSSAVVLPATAAMSVLVYLDRVHRLRGDQ